MPQAERPPHLVPVTNLNRRSQHCQPGPAGGRNAATLQRQVRHLGDETHPLDIAGVAGVGRLWVRRTRHPPLDGERDDEGGLGQVADMVRRRAPLRDDDGLHSQTEKPRQERGPPQTPELF